MIPARRVSLLLYNGGLTNADESSFMTTPHFSTLQRLARSLLFVCTGLLTLNAYAWGHAAHHAVALVAEQSLTPVARKNLRRLLLQEPGATLASVSSWADKQRLPGTAKWHYLNFPENQCQYQAARDCPDGACVVEAARQQIAILRSMSASDMQRLQALKYVVHLVADVHQPLHAGFAHDRGGNAYQVQAFGRGTNLHALWDTGLVQAIEPDAQKLASLLTAMPRVAPWVFADLGGSMIVAAEESCRIVRLPWFYPSRQVSSDYAGQSSPIISMRLRLASARLAVILNEALQH